MIEINQCLKPGTVPKQYELMQVIQIDLADVKTAMEEEALFLLEDSDLICCRRAQDVLEAFNRGELFLMVPINEPLEGAEIE